MKQIFYIVNTIFLILNRRIYKAFLSSAYNIKQAQLKVLLSIINSNNNSEIGQKFSFQKIKNVKNFQEQVPLMCYKDYEPFIKKIMKGESSVLCSENVRYLALSSGTIAPSKYIPYTDSLKKEFSKAINAWICDLLKHNHKIKYGSQFWIISPISTVGNVESKVPIGFESDSNYFGAIEKRLINLVMAVPKEINKVKDRNNYFYLICYFLIRNSELRLISVWNPSLLLSIYEFLNNHFSSLINDLRNGTLSLPNPRLKSDIELFSSFIKKKIKRAEELIQASEEGSINMMKIWPKLQLISCWTNSWAKVFIPDIQKIFPGVKIQGKGLLATEAAVTIPIEKANYPVLSPNAHFYEFKNIKDDKMYLAHELDLNQDYEIYITTGGGFYRYSLNDKVRVKGFYRKSPLLEFEGKKDKVSDITGEKLNDEHVNLVIKKITDKYLISEGHAFLGIQKHDNFYAYVLYVEKNKLKSLSSINELLNNLDQLLNENYHYFHSRQMKQLAFPGLSLIDKNDLDKYLEYKTKKEIRSTFKISKLETDIKLLSEISNNVIWF